MRWAVLVLLFANLALAGYLAFIDRGAGSPADVRVLELNADKVKVLKAPAADAGSPCLEWRNLSADALPHAQEALAKLGRSKFSVREQAILIADPSPALVARVTELKAGFPGSELKAVVCRTGAP